jgi:thiol-disulfide isomerase/thioredoxin
MMKQLFFSLFVAMLMATATTAQCAELPVLGKAPAWKLKDIQGREVSAADFKGKIVVIDFWATWCPPCRAEIPGYISLQKKYAEKGLVIIGISLDEDGAKAVAPFADAKGINYRMLLFNDDVVAAFGGIEGVPTTFLIDREGNIRDKKVGRVAEADYEKRILELLK